MKKQKQPEAVIPFSGEDDFIVRRTAVDDSDWKYVTATANPTDGTNTVGGVMTTILPTLPQLSQINAMACPELQTQIGVWQSWEPQFANNPDPALYAAYKEVIAYANNLYKTKCTVFPAYPFPDWKTLDCATVTSEMAKLQQYIDTTTFPDAATKTKAQSEYLLGVEQQAAVCKTPTPPEPKIPVPPVPVPPTTTTVTSTTQLIPSTGLFGAGFGAPIGGGGGGGSEEGAVSETPQKNNWWLWLLLVAGGVYLITRKKKAK